MQARLVGRFARMIISAPGHSANNHVCGVCRAGRLFAADFPAAGSSGQRRWPRPSAPPGVLRSLRACDTLFNDLGLSEALAHDNQFRRLFSGDISVATEPMRPYGWAETVRRPWYSPNSRSIYPDILMDNPVAITTRVAPSFLRVGQLELFARRVRRQAHPDARSELQMIVAHLIERNYRLEIDPALAFSEQVVALAGLFRTRLTSLVAHWIRVGYCQGNFNSDNCAAGGFTLDYGPFGFCELFDPLFQPWTAGGEHFCFFNQPVAAEANYQMFWAALRPLLEGNSEAMARLDQIRDGFAGAMQQELEAMWARKLGLITYDAELVNELLQLMERWHALIGDPQETSAAMQRVNPAITWREWLIAPAYEQAALGDTTLIQELQAVFRHPYEAPAAELAATYDRLKPREFFNAGGVSHYSCSS